MKMRRSVLLVAVCLLVVMSISVVAFAATSQVFRRGVLDGYDYVCKGDISGLVATATFTATANENLPHHPESDCTSSVWMFAYNERGGVLGFASSDGSVYTKATCTASDTIAYTSCEFVFMGTDLGRYFVIK